MEKKKFKEQIVILTLDEYAEYKKWLEHNMVEEEFMRFIAMYRDFRVMKIVCKIPDSALLDIKWMISLLMYPQISDIIINKKYSI